MVTVVNFKKANIVADSKEMAIEQMERDLFHYSGDATQAYKNWKAKQTGMVGERELKEFMLDYLAKKGKNCPNSGFLICIDNAVKDTRERPYTINNIKGDGKRKYKKMYQLVDKATGVVIKEVSTNKADAINVAKELIKDGFHGTLVCKLAHKVVEGVETVFEATYTPSKSTKKGEWICFGIMKD